MKKRHVVFQHTSFALSLSLSSAQQKEPTSNQFHCCRPLGSKERTVEGVIYLKQFLLTACWLLFDISKSRRSRGLLAVEDAATRQRQAFRRSGQRVAEVRVLEGCFGGDPARGVVDEHLLQQMAGCRRRSSEDRSEE